MSISTSAGSRAGVEGGGVAGVEAIGTVGSRGGCVEALGVEIAGGAFAAAFVAIGGKSVDDANDGTAGEVALDALKGMCAISFFVTQAV